MKWKMKWEQKNRAEQIYKILHRIRYKYLNLRLFSPEINCIQNLGECVPPAKSLLPILQRWVFFELHFRVKHFCHSENEEMKWRTPSVDSLCLLLCRLLCAWKINVCKERKSDARHYQMKRRILLWDCLCEHSTLEYVSGALSVCLAMSANKAKICPRDRWQRHFIHHYVSRIHSWLLAHLRLHFHGNNYLLLIF